MPKAEDMDMTPPPASTGASPTAAQKLAALRSGQSANPASPGSTSTVTSDPVMSSTPSSSFGGSSYGGSSYGGSSSFGGSSQPVNNNANQATATQGAETLVKADEDWVNKKWRPMMGWVYMGTCTFDFVIAPILWSLLQAMTKGQVSAQWQPLTLQGAGLYHVAMGAVLGLTAYGRTKEKIEGAAGPGK